MTAEHRAIAFEDRKHGVEHVVHHLLQVARALNRAVDAVHALEEPHVLPVLVLRALALGDVPPDAPVADELPGSIEHGHSGHGHVALAAVRGGARQLEIAEGQVRVQHRAVLAPRLFVRLEVRNFPARLADPESSGGASVRLWRTPGG